VAGGGGTGQVPNLCISAGRDRGLPAFKGRSLASRVERSLDNHHRYRQSAIRGGPKHQVRQPGAVAAALFGDPRAPPTRFEAVASPSPRSLSKKSGSVWRV